MGFRTVNLSREQLAGHVAKDPLKRQKIAVERAYGEVLATGQPRLAQIFKHAAEEIILNDNPLFFEAIGRMKRVPVTLDEFVDSKEFLAGVEYDIWPTLREDLRAMNPDVLTGEHPKTLTALGGATGTGKSHLSTGTIAYQGYCLTCFHQPQRLFGLTPMTTMVCMLQSVSPTITKRVLYSPFRKMFTGMEYVKKWVPWNKKLESALQLEDNIEFIPAQASLQAILGQAVFAAILDEVNFMQVIEESKQVAGPQGLGGKYDQAEVVFSNIERRRARSFTTLGPSFGSICLVSSTRYKDDFLDRKIVELDEFAVENKERDPNYEPKHLTFRHKQFEVNPKLIAAAKVYGHFKVLIGTEEYSTRVLRDHEVEGEHYPEGAAIMDIPATDEYRAAFKKDPDAALRDVAGLATEAITPFFRRRHKIREAMKRGEMRKLTRWTEKDEYELSVDGMPVWDDAAMPPSDRVRNRPHYAHIDLSKNKDKCGIGLVRLEGFTAQQGGGDMIDMLPKLSVVAAIGIVPDVMHEIDIGEVRNFVLSLISMGINLRSITFDGFQSNESVLLVRKAGIYSDAVTSNDRDEANYEAARDTLYQDRLDIQPDCEGLALEMRTVEWYPERNSKRIDHPPRGTKDVLDGVVGAISGAINDRSVRSQVEVTDSSQDRVNVRENVRRQGTGRIVRKNSPRRL